MTEQLRGVRFNRAMAPYEAMDVAGFAPAKAQDLVDRGIADYWPRASAATGHETGSADQVDDILSGMTRADLVDFARKHLGTADEPPADVTDDVLRASIRAAVNAKLLKKKP